MKTSAKVNLKPLTAILLFVAAFIILSSCSNNRPKRAVYTAGPDDGSQMQSPFRLNYAGYLPLQDKLVVYIHDQQTPNPQEAIKWSLLNNEGNRVAGGISNNRRVNDHASGDSFFIIDFSDFQQTGEGFYLSVEGHNSSPFDINENPYGDLVYEFFDYFKDHRRYGDVFDRHVDNWTDHSVSLNYVADAGDKAGYYTVNAAEAQWHLINILESHPQINDYFYQHNNDMAKVYDELVFMSDPLHKVIFPGESLAVAKLHTNSNDSNMKCPGSTGTSGACVSKPETKATYAVARTLAAMARLHAHYGDGEQSRRAYLAAQSALLGAESTPYTCLSWHSFGGEGGYYPNNDNFSIWRNPRAHRAPCASGPIADPKDNNINDDQYAALVEMYLAAVKLNHPEHAEPLKQKVENHSHHQRVDKFYWAAVSTEATLSLLTHRPAGMNLNLAESNVFSYADNVLRHQDVGYPGVTFNTKSREWNSADEDGKDNNFRWGSNRMQLNDARILMMAAKLKYDKQEHAAAARYSNGVLRVLDQLAGTNAVALAMYTAAGYPSIEHAVTRTHDANVADSEAGKLVVGPNNWTNSNDAAMPEFGTQPGMKSFSLKGTGWASREVFIDGNAALVAVVYFAINVAPTYLEANNRLKHKS